MYFRELRPHYAGRLSNRSPRTLSRITFNLPWLDHRSKAISFRDVSLEERLNAYLNSQIVGTAAPLMSVPAATSAWIRTPS